MKFNLHSYIFKGSVSTDKKEEDRGNEEDEDDDISHGLLFLGLDFSLLLLLIILLNSAPIILYEDSSMVNYLNSNHNELYSL